MILYSLICEDGHEFEAWFRGSKDFDRQRDHGLVACPICGSNAVDRGLMAPSVSTSRKKAERAELAHKTSGGDTETSADTEEGGGTGSQVPVAVPDPRMAEVVETMRRVRDMVTKNADYVGNKFAEEARKIHYGEADKRGIYGEATLEDAKSLAEDGVDVLPLPVLPEDRN